jgi:hypothetical protein
MSIPAYVYGFKTFGKHTESAGTTIDEQVPGKDGQRLACIEALVKTQGTAHTMSFMYAEGTGSRNTASADAAAAQKDIVCTDDPKDPAGNAAAADDIIAYQLSDGSWEFNTVASVSSKTITLSNNISSPGVASGAKVNIFGVVADGANFPVSLIASTTNEYGKGEIFLVHPYQGEPFYVSIDNGTAASTIENLVFVYTNK